MVLPVVAKEDDMKKLMAVVAGLGATTIGSQARAEDVPPANADQPPVYEPTKWSPPFFSPRTLSALGSYPGAMLPSDTTPFRNSAVARSTVSESAAKSPNEHFGSAPRART